MSHKIKIAFSVKFKSDLERLHQILEKKLVSFDDCIKTTPVQYNNSAIIALLQEAESSKSDSRKGELVLSAHKKLIELEKNWEYVSYHEVSN